MKRKYRIVAVERAVKNWNRSEWFEAKEILPDAVKYINQPRGGLNALSVAKMLARLESSGLVESRESRGCREYRRVGDEEWVL